jgi:hypothetical protein
LWRGVVRTSLQVARIVANRRTPRASVLSADGFEVEIAAEVHG